MTACPDCGAGVRAGDRFCSDCGTDMAADDNAAFFDDPMGVSSGTRAAEPGHTEPWERAQGHDHGYDPQGYGDTGYPPADPHGYPAYDDQGYAQQAYDTPPAGIPYPDAAGADPAPRDRRRLGCIALPLIALALVIAVAGLTAWLGSRSPDSGPSPAAGSSTSAPEGSSSPSGEGSSGPSSASPSEGPTEITLPASAKRCGDVGGGAVAYRGNDVTSCPFAVDTGRSLVAEKPTLPATIEATSPVTKKDYEMQCDDTRPVRCQGGNNAVVYVVFSSN